MNKQYFIELAEKISTGVATEEEMAQFNQWYESFQQEDKKWLTEEFGDQNRMEAELLYRINRKINSKNIPRSPALYSLRNIAAVVLIFILAGGGLYWYFSASGDPDGVPLMVIQDDVQPGGDKAILTLSDGSRIVLDEASTGLLAHEGRAKIQKSAEGMVRYQTLEDSYESEKPVSKEAIFNTISTPQGGQYKVVLPDQSQVWLNALSSIQFPTSFDGDIREVTITGEVYFDVMKDSGRPFQVKSGGQVIKVLGTQFNVNAYENEATIRTTLVEGAVTVQTGNKEVRILPGQQAINDRNRDIKVQVVDTEQVIAWKNGLFQFWNTDLQEIMRQLSRWYGVEINYLNEAHGKTFSGFIRRDVTLSNVLRMLEMAGNVQFGLKNNIVSVKTEKNKTN